MHGYTTESNKNLKHMVHKCIVIKEYENILLQNTKWMSVSDRRHVGAFYSSLVFTLPFQVYLLFGIKHFLNCLSITCMRKKILARQKKWRAIANSECTEVSLPHSGRWLGTVMVCLVTPTLFRYQLVYSLVKVFFLVYNLH